jgi:hypothetical protein
MKVHKIDSDNAIIEFFDDVHWVCEIFALDL